MRLGRTLLHASGLLDEDRRGRGLHDEGEALVREGGDHHRNRQTRLHALGLGVERLAEFHDVQATLTQSRAIRGGGVSLTSRHLQLATADDLLRHALLLAGYIALACADGAPRGLISGLFDLAEIELDGRGATKNGDGHTNLALFVVDFFDVAVEVRKRTFLDPNHLAHFE